MSMNAIVPASYGVPFNPLSVRRSHGVGAFAQASYSVPFNPLRSTGIGACAGCSGDCSKCSLSGLGLSMSDVWTTISENAWLKWGLIGFGAAVALNFFGPKKLRKIV